MSLTDEQKAIAKVQVQGCRRWMNLIILTPVLLCIILTLIAPTIRDFLAQRETSQQCQVLSSQYDAVPVSTIVTDEAFISDTVISMDNLEQIVLLGEATLRSPIPSRDTITAIAHPDGDYSIYASYGSSESVNFFICADGEALGAFSAEANTGDLVFDADGRLFAITDSGNGQVMVFDGVNIERLENITLSDNRRIDSLAFHPTEPLLFFTSEDELFIYDTDNFQQQLRLPIFETAGQEIGFSADGTRLFMVHVNDEATAYVWGIQD